MEAAEIGLPQPLLERLRTRWGHEAVRHFSEAWNNPVRVSIRVNPEKTIPFTHVPSLPIPWTATGRWLHERPVFTLDPLFHAGAYYVQEASSMLLEPLYRFIRDQIPTPVTILDLCAAPGGKSTHLASLLSPGDCLVSNEIIQARNAVLRENLIRWSSLNTLVTRADPAVLGQYHAVFDVLVTDVPCSGEGLFHRDPSLVSEWNEGQAHACSLRQKRILSDAIPALKPGGFLLYSTCTLAEEENEWQVDWLCETQGFISCSPTLEFPGIETIHTPQGHTAFRCWPGKSGGEGFFIACLQKKEDSAERGTFIRGEKSARKEKSSPIWQEWTTKAVTEVHQKGHAFWIDPVAWERIQSFVETAPVTYAGIRLGEKKGKDYIPSPEMAFFPGLHTDRIPEWALSREDAIRYLSAATPAARPPGMGWHKVTIDQLGLGWVKVLDNRVNSYYPKEWRIRMQTGL